MKENVGKKDQLIRSFIGPGLMVFGYYLLKDKKGDLPGLTSVVLGSLIAQSAVTKVCPVNYFFGLDTRRKQSPISKIKKGFNQKSLFW